MGGATIRQRALLLGFLLALYPAVERLILPLLEYGGAFLFGILIGSMAVVAVGKEYLKNGRTMEVSYAFRLAYLMPGEVSHRAVAFLDEMTSKMRNRTVQYLAVGFLERLFRFLLRREAGPVAIGGVT